MGAQKRARKANPNAIDSSEAQADFDGNLITPEAADYERARMLWNGVIDRRPGAILSCKSPADVVQGINMARREELQVSVRGGGHNVAGSALVEDGLVLDLSPMNEVQVHPSSHTVHAGGGATWAQVDAATQEHGLAVPGGVVSDTGIGGLTLGGGIGWIRRKHGLSCDNMKRAQVVTANGEIQEVGPDQHPELFWALRGGGGGFAAVTRFEYEAHPVGPEVMFAFVMYPGELRADGLRFYDEYSRRAPREVSSFAILGTVPAEEEFPEEIHGESYLLLAAMYAGPVDEGQEALSPLRSFAEPMLDMSTPMPYVEVQQILDEDYPEGARYYWKSLYLEHLGVDEIQGVIEWADRRPSPLSTVDVWHLGGAIDDVAIDDSAYPARGLPYLLGVEANWQDPASDQPNFEWARSCVADMQEHSAAGMYVNFPGFHEGGEQAVQRTYGRHVNRLQTVKRRHDPDELFTGGLGW